MKIAVLGGYNNSFTVAVILKLLQQGETISTVIIKKGNPVESAQIAIAKSELKKKIVEKLNRLFFKKAQRIESDNAYLKDYLERLNVPLNINLKQVMEVNNITPFLVNSINEEKCLVHLRTLNPNIIVYTGGGIVRRKLIEIPSIGILNAHMAYLPDYKGMNVLEWAVLNNDMIGITIHFIDVGIDTGDILLKKEVPLNKNDTIQSLRAKSVSISVDALSEVIASINSNTIKPQKQKEEGKQYFVMHERFKEVVNDKLKQRMISS
jgi:methionyl-tRNA formyltransferase